MHGWQSEPAGGPQGGLSLSLFLSIALCLSISLYLSIDRSVSLSMETCFAPQQRALFRHRNFQKWSECGVLLCAFHILTWKCLARHKDVHFLDISNSKSGPNVVCKCISHVAFEMCFAPQRRVLLQQLNVQECTDHEVFSPWVPPNALRATVACTFWTSQLPKVAGSCGLWSLWNIFTSKSASRHNGVQSFISHLPRWLRTRCFSKPTFRPSGATKSWKQQCFATFLPFRTFWSSLFWLFPPLLFHLSILSEVWFQNFLRLIAIYLGHRYK